MYLYPRYKHFITHIPSIPLTEICCPRTLFHVKKDLRYIIPVCIYEFFRCFALFVIRPEQQIELLPVSWYVCIFALFLPVILAFFSFRKEDATYSWLYYLVKIAQDAGIAKYIFDDWPYAVSLGFQNDYYSLSHLFSLVSFLLIDVILLIVLFIYQKKRKVINADNSSSER